MLLEDRILASTLQHNIQSNSDKIAYLENEVTFEPTLKGHKLRVMIYVANTYTLINFNSATNF